MGKAVKTHTDTLEGCHVLVTAGPTHEAIDPVRYLANASSGKMGYAVAEAARDAGARVTLVSGPVELAAPDGIELVSVVSAADMFNACLQVFPRCDVAILAAAVADFTPVSVADHKIKKAEGGLACIELKETQDILRALCAHKEDRLVVGFAAETNELISNARAKRTQKGADMIVANDVSRTDSTFGSDTDRVVLVCARGEIELPTLPKSEVARIIIEKVASLRKERKKQ